MKATKAQQAILTMMKEGRELSIVNRPLCDNHAYIGKNRIRTDSVESMAEEGLIEEQSSSTSSRYVTTTIYQIIESKD